MPKWKFLGVFGLLALGALSVAGYLAYTVAGPIAANATSETAGDPASADLVPDASPAEEIKDARRSSSPAQAEANNPSAIVANIAADSGDNSDAGGNSTWYMIGSKMNQKLRCFDVKQFGPYLFQYEWADSPFGIIDMLNKMGYFQVVTINTPDEIAIQNITHPLARYEFFRGKYNCERKLAKLLRALAPPPPPTPPTDFQKGESDRLRYEDLFSGLSDEFRAGWAFRAAHGKIEQSPRNASDAWFNGYMEAQGELSGPEALSESSPEYKRGWNSGSPTAAITNARPTP